MPASSFDVRKDLLTTSLLLHDAFLVLLLISSISGSLVFQQLLQPEVLLCESHGLDTGLLHEELLVLVQAFDLERGPSVQQLIPSPEVFALALFIVIQQNPRLVVLIVNLFEVAILATSDFLPV